MQMKQSKIYSMTGYIKHSASDIRFGNLAWEIKSLNNKYCDVKVNLPTFLSELDNEIINKVKKSLSRGSIKINLTYEPFNNKVLNKTLDVNKVSEIQNHYEMLADYLPLNKFNPNDLLNNKALFTISVSNINELKHFIIDSLSISIKNILFMRYTEGQVLWGSILDKTNNLAMNLQSIKSYAKSVVNEELLKINKKISKLDLNISQEKILQEAYFLAEKVDIQEEVTRIESHITQFLTLDELNKPIGKKAEFLCQELLREINTIGSKSSNINIINLTLEMKVITDQIKEQVMNIV